MFIYFLRNQTCGGKKDVSFSTAKHQTLRTLNGSMRMNKKLHKTKREGSKFCSRKFHPRKVSIFFLSIHLAVIWVNAGSGMLYITWPDSFCQVSRTRDQPEKIRRPGIDDLCDPLWTYDTLDLILHLGAWTGEIEAELASYCAQGR